MDDSGPDPGIPLQPPLSQDAKAVWQYDQIKLQKQWLVVFLVNLPVVLQFGWGTTHAMARVGMGLGMASLYALGSLACIRWRFGSLALSLGGKYVGLLQLFPIGHLIAGMFGVAAGRAISGLPSIDPVRSPALDGLLGGLVATIVTGGILMLVALAFGSMLMFARPNRWWALFRVNDDSLGKKPLRDEFHDFA